MSEAPRTIAVAPDSFKGTLDAHEAAAAMAAGVRQWRPDARVESLPMADGGEGTATLLAEVTGGQRLTHRTEDPLGRPLRAEVAVLGDGTTWAVDTAAASGLTHLADHERDPLVASSAGTGRLIRRAVDAGAQHVLLGLGGSATVDGGKGLCEDLGFRFLDDAGRPLAAGGGSLCRLASNEDPAERPVALGRIRVACDVRNPLLGPQGAARVFAPQKGASPAAVERLEQGLTRLAEVLRSRPGPCGAADIATLPGTGAAGGIGACLVALLGATLESGGELVFEAAGYGDRLTGCDLVILGEGRMDGQTAGGKAPAVVASHAGRKGVPVMAVMGQAGPGIETLDFLADWEASRPAGDHLPAPAEARAELTAATARLLGRSWPGPPR